MLDAKICYQAVKAKDVRFDGIFYVGVHSTGIYCRPICPARTPKQTGCQFFRHASEAERAGFRACFRCRPERAPGNSSVDANNTLAYRAVCHIESGYLQEHSVDDLAAELDVTGRHLRRVLLEKLGVTPLQLAQSRRLALAKQLLQDTSLSITDVAFASGFASLRRFHSAFLEHFERSPSSFRKEHQHVESSDLIRLRLDYRPPLAWTTLLHFLQARCIPGVEYVAHQRLYRTMRWREQIGWISIGHAESGASLDVEISLSLLDGLMPIQQQIRKAMDLDAHPAVIAEHLKQDPFLAARIETLPGLRIPGAIDPFAVMVRIILGQQISVKAATTLSGRLAQSFGEPVVTPHPFLSHLFPSPQSLADCCSDEIAALGLSKQRAQTIQALAQAVLQGDIPLSSGANIEELQQRLRAIPGIGHWTIECMLMRVFGHPDACPSSDLGLQKGLGHKNPRHIEQITETWRPWRSYGTLYVWNVPTP